MSLKPLPPGVHVILGESAAGIFRRAFGRVGERLVIDRDVLCCGPTPHCESLEAWCRMRHAFWSSMPAPSDELPNAASFGLLDARERLREAERITIWAATSLSEQLFIAHGLHRAEQWGVDPNDIHLVQFETNRGARVLGMGELNEQRMSEHPEPVPIGEGSLLRDYRAAWTALTSPDPMLIARFSEMHPAANAWLRQAMQLMLRRFPDKRSALPWWDSMLLDHTRSRGPRATRVIGQAMVNAWDDADLVGDLYLFGRLLRLGDSRLPAPLLEITGDRTNMRDVGVTLTPFRVGRAGRQDVELPHEPHRRLGRGREAVFPRRRALVQR